MAEQKLTEQERVRRQKMQDLIDMGIDPFGSAYQRTTTSGKIIAQYEDKTKEELIEEIDEGVVIFSAHGMMNNKESSCEEIFIRMIRQKQK